MMSREPYDCDSNETGACIVRRMGGGGSRAAMGGWCRGRCAPLLCWVTPRKEEEPRVKPGLVRRMAMTSSAMGTVSSRSSRAVYLPAINTHQPCGAHMPRHEAGACAPDGHDQLRHGHRVQPVQQSGVHGSAKQLKIRQSCGLQMSRHKVGRQRCWCRSRRSSRAQCLPAMPKSSKAR